MAFSFPSPVRCLYSALFSIRFIMPAAPYFAGVLSMRAAASDLQLGCLGLRLVVTDPGPRGVVRWQFADARCEGRCIQHRAPRDGAARYFHS